MRSGEAAEAAEAAAELEFLANEIATNPRYAPEANPAVGQQLDVARREMREFLGVAPSAAPSAATGSTPRATSPRRRKRR